MTKDGMNRSRELAGTIGALAVLMGLSFPAEAAAQEACGDQTCPKGFACEDVPAACPAIACAPDSDCPPCPATVLACVAQSCTSDSDCDVDMVCLTESITECTGTTPACEPNRECPPAPPPECETVERSQCVPRWALECQSAADCGEGFACVAQEECSCSGSPPSSGSGTSGMPAPSAVPPAPPSDAGSANGGASGDPKAPAPQPPEPAERPDDSGAVPPGAEVPPSNPDAPVPPDTCSCRPTGRSVCEVVEQECNVDADCPSRWSCQDNPNGVCWSGPDGASGCEPADPPKLCVPPYQNLGGSVGRGEANGGSGTPTTGGPVSPEPPPSLPQQPGSPASGPNPEPALEPSDDAEEGAPDVAATDSRGGCSVTAAPAAGSSNGALFAALAALAFAARRRLRGHARAE